MNEQSYTIREVVPEYEVKPIPGTKKVKDPFTGEQKKQAGFAVRMENAVKQLEALENSGFNPVNVYDMVVSNLPIVPDAIERYLNTPKFKQYERAKIDFSTAQLKHFFGLLFCLSTFVDRHQTEENTSDQSNRSHFRLSPHLFLALVVQ